MISWRIVYEFFVLLLIVNYAILILFAPEGHPILTPEFMSRLDLGLIVYFAVEYSIRLWRAPDKKQFVLKNWFDLLAMIPVNSGFRFMRLLRLLRLLRLIKASPMLWTVLSSKHIQTILLITTGMIVWSASGIYLLEKDINPSISHFSDAIWWAVVTTTTVGYGDISPITTGGRLLAVALMLTGIGLIGTITANLANHWVSFFREETPLEERSEQNQVENELRSQVKGWIDHIDQLNDKEYATLLETLEFLKNKKSNNKKMKN